MRRRGIPPGGHAVVRRPSTSAAHRARAAAVRSVHATAKRSGAPVHRPGATHRHSSPRTRRRSRRISHGGIEERGERRKGRKRGSGVAAYDPTGAQPSPQTPPAGAWVGPWGGTRPGRAAARRWTAGTPVHEGGGWGRRARKTRGGTHLRGDHSSTTTSPPTHTSCTGTSINTDPNQYTTRRSKAS